MSLLKCKRCHGEVLTLVRRPDYGLVCDVCAEEIDEEKRQHIEPFTWPEDKPRGWECEGCGKFVTAVVRRFDGERYIRLCDSCAGVQPIIATGKGRNRPDRFSASIRSKDGGCGVHYKWGDDHGGRGKRVFEGKYPSKQAFNEEACQETEELASAESKGKEYRDHETRRP